MSSRECPHADKVKVAHPLMLRAIAAAKRKNDRVDAGKIADCLRCDFLPECHMASTEIRDRRRTLRYRNLVLKQMVQMKNRVSGLLKPRDMKPRDEKYPMLGSPLPFTIGLLFVPHSLVPHSLLDE